MRRYTTADVKRTYSPAKAREEWYGDWASALIYRPLSFLITPLFLSLSVSASAVTLISLILGLSLPLLALFGGTSGAWFVALLATLWVILDCVDGNIARVTGTSSPAGRYFDFVTDVLFRGSFYVAIGILTDAGHGYRGLALCLAAGYAAMAARFCRQVYHQGGGEDVYSETAGPADATGLSLVKIVFAFLSGIDRLLPLTLLAATYFHRLFWIAWFLLAYSLADLVYSLFRIFLDLRAKRV